MARKWPPRRKRDLPPLGCDSSDFFPQGKPEMVVTPPGGSVILGFHIRGVNDAQPLLGIRMIKGEPNSCAISENGLQFDITNHAKP